MCAEPTARGAGRLLSRGWYGGMGRHVDLVTRLLRARGLQAR